MFCDVAIRSFFPPPHWKPFPPPPVNASPIREASDPPRSSSNTISPEFLEKRSRCAFSVPPRPTTTLSSDWRPVKRIPATFNSTSPSHSRLPFNLSTLFSPSTPLSRWNLLPLYALDPEPWPRSAEDACLCAPKRNPPPLPPPFPAENSLNFLCCFFFRFRTASFLKKSTVHLAALSPLVHCCPGVMTHQETASQSTPCLFVRPALV